MTQLPEWAPAGLDVTRPGAARVHDHFFGCAHNPEQLAGYAGVGRKG